jgi:hypothetical protein
VRPIGPVVLRNRSSLKAGVRTSYFSCKRPVRAPKEDECRWLCFTDLMIVSDGTRRWLRETASVYEPAMLPLLSVPFGARPAASTDVYFSRQSSSSVPCWQPLPLPLLRARSWFCHAYQSFRCQCFCHSCRHCAPLRCLRPSAACRLIDVVSFPGIGYGRQEHSCKRER